MEKIVFLDRDTIAPQITLKRPAFDHDWIEYNQTAADQVVARLQGATIAITNKVALRAETLAQLPDLKMIAVAATGYDCVDVPWCRAHTIAVANVQGYSVNTVPEHTFGMILSLRRSLMAYHSDVAAGVWEQSDQFCFFNHPIRDLAQSNLVIVGGGVLGQSVARLGQAFGMQVYFAERKGQKTVRDGYTAWEDSLALADVISLHCPLNDQTRGMIALPEFQAMKRKPLLINVARGGVVDESDFLHADSPLKALLNRPDFILTPHVAWASNEAQQTLSDQLIENIEKFHAGTPQNLVSV